MEKTLHNDYAISDLQSVYLFMYLIAVLYIVEDIPTYSTMGSQHTVHLNSKPTQWLESPG